MSQDSFPANLIYIYPECELTYNNPGMRTVMRTSVYQSRNANSRITIWKCESLLGLTAREHLRCYLIFDLDWRAHCLAFGCSRFHHLIIPDGQRLSSRVD